MIYQLPHERAPSPWPATATVRFTSSDPSIAAVSDSGWLVARHPGTAVIRVATGGLTDSGTVAVLTADDTPSDPLVQVAAGGQHTCGLGASGRAYCWGGSWFGELGTGTVRKFTATVAPVAVLGTEAFRSITAGQRHACALDVVGQAWCWGENLYGQIGDGTTTLRARPSRVHGEVRYAAISAGGDHTCALNTAGMVYCWGRIAGGGGRTPAPVAPDVRFVEVVAGGEHACGLASDGILLCWGSNEYGQLGTGSSTLAASPTPIAGGHRFASASAGQLHTCALDLGGAAYCWGSGGSGRLGTQEGNRTPKPVVSDASFARISAGGEHTCGVTTTGVAYCWGSNFRGQVGNGSPADAADVTSVDLVEPVPVPVAGALVFQSINASLGEHTCGTTEDSSVYCWGLNISGQLGYGRQDYLPGTQLEMRTAPAKVVVPLP